MPATINLSTISGSVERNDHSRAMILEICGTPLGRETVTIATVAELRTAVQAFGARVRAVHPDASFLVSISIRKGYRKPRGYDAAYHGNGFGQEDFLHVTDKRTKPPVEPTAATAGAAASTAA